MIVIAALLVDVFLLAVAAVLSITLTTETKVARLSAEQAAAYYSAEAALAEVEARIQRGSIGNEKITVLATTPDRFTFSADTLYVLAQEHDGPLAFEATCVPSVGSPQFEVIATGYSGQATARVAALLHFVAADSTLYVLGQREIPHESSIPGDPAIDN